MEAPSDFNNQRSENNYRGRGFQNSRPQYRVRGRGRGRGDERFYNVQRALNDLGVSDLREHLDRKHQNEVRSPPPSDPSYNYLRDPMRDGAERSLKGPNIQRANSRRGRSATKAQEPTFIQNPTNFKVEISTATGQRSIFVKEDSTLADIKHVPDYEYQDTRSRGHRSVRARGRGRYVSDQDRCERAKSTERRKEENRGSQVRSRSVEARGDYSNRGSYRGRDSYSTENTRQSDFRGRGRVRGRGRGRGRRGRGGQQPNVEVVQPVPDISPQENWDDELFTDTSTEKNDSFEDRKDHLEYKDNPEEPQENENLDAEDKDFKEKENSDKVNVQDNLVIISSMEDEKKKRSVRFKEGDDGQREDDGGEKEVQQVKG